jgi:hypothetical protein
MHSTRWSPTKKKRKKKKTKQTVLGTPDGSLTGPCVERVKRPQKQGNLEVIIVPSASRRWSSHLQDRFYKVTQPPTPFLSHLLTLLSSPFFPQAPIRRTQIFGFIRPAKEHPALSPHQQRRDSTSLLEGFEPCRAEAHPTRNMLFAIFFVFWRVMQVLTLVSFRPRSPLSYPDPSERFAMRRLGNWGRLSGVGSRFATAGPCARPRGARDCVPR